MGFNLFFGGLLIILIYLGAFLSAFSDGNYLCDLSFLICLSFNTTFSLFLYLMSSAKGSYFSYALICKYDKVYFLLLKLEQLLLFILILVGSGVWIWMLMRLSLGLNWVLDLTLRIVIIRRLTNILWLFSALLELFHLLLVGYW